MRLVITSSLFNFPEGSFVSVCFWPPAGAPDEFLTADSQEALTAQRTGWLVGEDPRLSCEKLEMMFQQFQTAEASCRPQCEQSH